MNYATFNVYPQYNRKGQKYSRDGITDNPCWINVHLNGPLPSDLCGKCSAVGDDQILGEIQILAVWFASNGFMLIGIEHDGLKRFHQEWWCTPCWITESSAKNKNKT